MDFIITNNMKGGFMLIIKKIYPVIPPKTEYSLSELGKTLVPILDSMCEWGQQFMSTDCTY